MADFKDLLPEEEKRIREIGTKKRRKNEIIAGLKRNLVDHLWYRPKIPLTIDEFVEKVLQGEQDFTNCTFRGRNPDLSSHEGLQELNKYFRDRYLANPTCCINISGSNFKDTNLSGAYIPLLIANNTNLSGSQFSNVEMAVVFNEKTNLYKATFKNTTLKGEAHKTEWKGADITNTIFDELFLFYECDMKGVKGLGKAKLHYENFVRVNTSQTEADIIDTLPKRTAYIRKK